jgi:hypothetical protein
MNRICIFCGRSFEPYPTVPNQQYCSRPQCQKARRRKWQKEKLATERNRQFQRQRNRRKQQSSGVDRSVIAKMDELTSRNDSLSGHYRLVPIDRSGVAKMDELIVKIDVITASCAMGP